MAMRLITNKYTFSQTSKMVVIRHGESLWNKHRRWTGWNDVRLSSGGIKQAKECGKLLKDNGFVFDEAYSSILTRSIQTLNYVLDQLEQHYIPVTKSWRLNEKHYGVLTMTEKYGQEKVAQWRRSFSISPPPVEITDPRHPSKDKRYADVDPKDLPCSQNQSDVIKRLYPLWNTQLRTKLLSGKNILISAHGGSARSLAKIITNMPDEDVMELNLPHAVPLVFTFQASGDKLLMKSMEYIGNLEDITAKMMKIKNQTKPNLV